MYEALQWFMSIAHFVIYIALLAWAGDRIRREWPAFYAFLCWKIFEHSALWVIRVAWGWGSWQYYDAYYLDCLMSSVLEVWLFADLFARVGHRWTWKTTTALTLAAGAFVWHLSDLPVHHSYSHSVAVAALLHVEAFLCLITLIVLASGRERRLNPVQSIFLIGFSLNVVIQYLNFSAEVFGYLPESVMVHVNQPASLIAWLVIVYGVRHAQAAAFQEQGARIT